MTFVNCKECGGTGWDSNVPFLDCEACMSQAIGEVIMEDAAARKAPVISAAAPQPQSKVCDCNQGRLPCTCKEAPQPTVLGGELVRYRIDGGDGAGVYAEPDSDGNWVLFSDAAPLQADIASERALRREHSVRIHQLKDELKDVTAERDQLKAQRNDLEGLMREVVMLDPHGEFIGWRLDGLIDAALSKPAGIDKVVNDGKARDV